MRTITVQKGKQNGRNILVAGDKGYFFQNMIHVILLKVEKSALGIFAYGKNTGFKTPKCGKKGVVSHYKPTKTA